MNSKITAIFFDVGNTLLFPNRERVHAPLAARGITLDPSHLRSLEGCIKNDFDLLMTEDGSHDHNFWHMYYSQLFADIGLKDDALRDQLVSSIRESANWDQILPGTRERLQQIGNRYRIGIISNADGRIEAVLQRCEISDCFLTITDSGLVGYEKPHPEFFRHALKSLNVSGEESLYVGDIYSVDFLGAKGAGMQAVLMDMPGAYVNKGVPRVESLAQLETFLSDARSAGLSRDVSGDASGVIAPG